MATPPLPCREIDPETFFPIGNSRNDEILTETAKSHCRRCPIQTECLNYALDQAIGYGVWGGHTAAERMMMLRSLTTEQGRV